MEEIEKPWCTYSHGLWSSGFGKIVRDNIHSVDIRYSEGQMYAPECWDPKFVIRFNSLEEAVEHYIQHRGGVDVRDKQSTPDGVREFARRIFPSYFKK